MGPPERWHGPCLSPEGPAGAPGGPDPAAPRTGSRAPGAPVSVEPWNPDLSTLTQDVLAYARGREAALAAVTVGAPADVDPHALAGALRRLLSARGMPGVDVRVLQISGEARLLAVEFTR